MGQHEQTITKQLVLTWDIHDLKRYSSVTKNNYYFFILVMHTTIQLFFFTIRIFIHIYFKCYNYYIAYIYHFKYSLYYTLKVWVVINVLFVLKTVSAKLSKAKVRRSGARIVREKKEAQSQKLVWNLTFLSVQRHCLYLTDNRKQHRQNQPVHLHPREQLITLARIYEISSHERFSTPPTRGRASIVLWSTG